MAPSRHRADGNYTNMRFALIPQRSSLRRAVRASLASPTPSHPRGVVKKTKSGLQTRAVGKRDTHEHAPLSSVPKPEAVTPTEPKWRSYRLALRESMSATAQTSLPSVPLTPTSPPLGEVTEELPQAPEPSTPETPRPISMPPSAFLPTPTLTPKGKLIIDDGKAQDDKKLASTTNGWYEVRGIVHEAPGGLYLVEWEGVDPRTGVMWPASWVKAKDVSAGAIRAWEKAKLQMLSGSDDKVH